MESKETEQEKIEQKKNRRKRLTQKEIRQKEESGGQELRRVSRIINEISQFSGHDSNMSSEAKSKRTHTFNMRQKHVHLDLR